MTGLKMFVDGDNVVLEAPGDVECDEDGKDLVTFPPNPKIFNEDEWESAGGRIRMVLPKAFATTLQDMFGEQPTLDRFSFGSGGVQFTSSHDGAKILASHFLEVLDTHQAENYVDIHLTDPQGEDIVVSIHRSGGKTAHQLRLAAEAARDDSNAELVYTRKRIEELCGKMGAVDHEIAGTPIVLDVSDRKHPQWSLELAPARKLREERDALRSVGEEMQEKVEWWINTCNYNIKRADDAVATVQRVEATCGEMDNLVEQYQAELQSCSGEDMGHFEVMAEVLRAASTKLREAIHPEVPAPSPNRDVEVRGDWMQTYSGGVFWPLEPKPEDVLLIDIAVALSNTCRFSGQVNEFYSVAQHSVLASYLVPEQDAKWALLHDAAEAYLCDLVRPIKHSAGGEWFRRIESNIMRCVCERFGMSYKQPASVDEADLTMLGTERRDLMSEPPRPWKWVGVAEPEQLKPWSVSEARYNFLARAKQLGIEGA